MKRLGNLYDKIISLDNLRLADERARKGKLPSYGVKLHDRNKEANLLSLSITRLNLFAAACMPRPFMQL